MSRFSVCRWVSSADKAKLAEFVEKQRSAIAYDLDGAPVFLATSAFSLKYEQERAPGIEFTEIKDYQIRQAA